jgi:CcmD family protein
MIWVFAAYTIIFTAIFIYTWSLGSRQKDLERRLEELKEQLKESRR